MSLDSKKNFNLSDKVVEYALTRDTGEFEILSVDSIARDFDVNRRKLLRSFKLEKDMTVKEFLFRVKIIEAAFLLKDNENLSVKQVGENIGYYSYNYFIHIFKQYLGTSPGRYRELKSGQGAAADWERPGIIEK